MSENNKGYKYKELFSDEASKAKAFDEIAETVFAKSLSKVFIWEEA